MEILDTSQICFLGLQGTHLFAEPSWFPYGEHNCLQSRDSLGKSCRLSTNTKLQYLELCGNSLTPAAAEELLKGLKANKGLRKPGPRSEREGGEWASSFCFLCFVSSFFPPFFFCVFPCLFKILFGYLFTCCFGFHLYLRK